VLAAASGESFQPQPKPEQDQLDLIARPPRAPRNVLPARHDVLLPRRFAITLAIPVLFLPAVPGNSESLADTQNSRFARIEKQLQVIFHEVAGAYPRATASQEPTAHSPMVRPQAWLECTAPCVRIGKKPKSLPALEPAAPAAQPIPTTPRPPATEQLPPSPARSSPGQR
jgi:hypothetical protein